jgi:hypothetical protein
VKTCVYIGKEALTNELKRDEIESADTCKAVEVIANSFWIEVAILNNLMNPCDSVYSVRHFLPQTTVCFKN